MELGGEFVVRIYICEDMSEKNIGNEKFSAVFAKKCIFDFLDIDTAKYSVAFRYNTYGKPFIKDIYNSADGSKFDITPQFSISHSENIIVCAVAYFNIGLDCQKKSISDADKCRKIAKRFYADGENEFLDALESDAYIDNFFEIWAKKEAYIKYTGKGIAEGMKDFSVADCESGQKNYLSDKNIDVIFKRIDIKNEKDFVVYLCYNKGDNEEINNKNQPEILLRGINFYV